MITGGGFVFLSGRMPNETGTWALAPEAETDPEYPFSEEAIKAQTDYVLADLVDTLTAAGSGVANVVKAQVYLDRLEDFHAFDAVWGRYFSDRPPRTTVQAGPLPLHGARLLVQLTAFRNAGPGVKNVASERSPAPMVSYSQGRRADLRRRSTR